MTVNEAISKLELKALALPEGERDITGGYCGDLLSWVMGRAESDCAWITIMSNVNIIAVATLCDPACIIVAEGAEVDEDVIARANTMGINLLSNSQTAFELAGKLYAMI